jgi:hypothetical protein
MSILRFACYLSIHEKTLPRERDAAFPFRAETVAKPKTHLTNRKAASYLARANAASVFLHIAV